MSAPRVFITDACQPGEIVELDPGDARHCGRVLRMKSGDEIVVVSNGVAWRGALTDVRGDRARARIIAPDERTATELPVAVIVLQAVPKGTKMDEVIEKIVELGAARLVPVRGERCYGGDSPAKLERWRRIARAAASQSQRLFIPEVEEPISLSRAFQDWPKKANVIVADENSEQGSLARALSTTDNRPIAIAIGPEGSFSSGELRQAREAGCACASLGPTVLRTETAAAAMLAAIAALRGWW